jgi:hypothetical protein
MNSLTAASSSISQSELDYWEIQAMRKQAQAIAAKAQEGKKFYQELLEQR